MASLNPIAQIPVNARTAYWLDVWDEQLRLYSVHTDGFDFSTLPVALDILIEDTAKRHRQSRGIRKTVLDILHSTKGHPLFRKTSLGADLTLLISNVQRSRLALANELARLLRDAINARGYSDSLAEELANLVQPSDVFTQRERTDLFELTKDAISRLLRRGFSRQSVQSIPGRLFSATTGNDGQTFTTFPRHYLRTNGGTGDRRTWHPMSPQEQAAFAALTQSDRILVLADYMHAEPTTYKCIFSIDGLSGPDRVFLGNLALYSPTSESQLPTGATSAEFFGQDPTVNPVNAYIEIGAIDVEQAQQKARAEVEAALDALNLASPPPPMLTVRPGRWIFIDPNSPAFYGFTEPTSPSASNLHFTTKSTRGVVARFAELHAPPALPGPSVPDSGLVHELATSLYWLRRAEESTRPADHLLFNWMAFEKLFSKPTHESTSEEWNTFSDIAELYPLIDTYIYALQLADWPAIYIDTMWQGAFRLNYTPRLSAELLQVIYRLTNPVPVAEFLGNLRLNIDQVENERFKEHLTKYFACVDNPPDAHDLLSELLDRSANELAIIYWLRNRLVHGGEFTFPFIGYYVATLDSATRTLLKIVADQRNWPNGASSPYDVLMPLYLDGMRLMENLRNGLGDLAQCSADLRPVHAVEAFSFRNPYISTTV